MNAVIIYDECEAAARANALLERASERADAATQWNVKPWRVDALRRPPLGQAALRDAAEAHLLVLAVRTPTHTPSWLLTWLEVWAGRRQVQDAALAVFDGVGEDTLSAVVSTELSALAERQGLSFICGDVEPAPDEWAQIWEDAPQGEVVQTSRLAHTVAQARGAFLSGASRPYHQVLVLQIRNPKPEIRRKSEARNPKRQVVGRGIW